MNGNDKNLKDNDHAKNCKIPVPTNESIRKSVHPRNSLHSSIPIEICQFYNKTREKTNFDVSTAMTKRLCHVLAEKGPQIHEMARKCHAHKLCAGQPNNPTSLTVQDETNCTKRERKYSKILVSNDKSSKSVSRKQQSVLKTNRDTVTNDTLNDRKTKKTACQTNGKSSLPRVKEAPRKTVLPLAEHVKQREYRMKDHCSKRKERPQFVLEESERVNRRQENYYTRKYSKKVKLEDKVKLNNKNSDKNNDNSEKAERMSSRKIVTEKNTINRKTVCNDNDNTTNREGHGAARTRIFKHQKSSQVDKKLTMCKDGISKKETKCSRKEFRTENRQPITEQDKVEQENGIISNSTKRNCEQDSNNLPYANTDDNIISLYDGSFKTPESSINCNQQQESRDTFAGLIGKRADNNCRVTANSETNCERSLSEDIKIDLSQETVTASNKGTGVSCDECLSEKNKDKLITDSISKELDHDYQGIKKSLTVSKIPSVTQDEIIYHTNLLNYGYDSDQQYCKLFNERIDRQHSVDRIIKLNTVDKIQSTDSVSAKYDLIKALIQPVKEICDFKTANHKVQKLLLSGYSPEHVTTCNDGELINANMNSFNDDCINDCMNEDNISNLESSEIYNPQTSEIHQTQPLSNTSDYIVMNSKMKNCKNAKKYRHFKHEGKDMCCNMARYIQRMISNEKKCQEFEKKENLERKVKIIIDENSPKTSKVRIVNDHSSVSVVCHSLGRPLYSTKRRNDTMANKVESSGGESSGYKSFHNNLDAKNIDGSDHIDIISRSQQDIQNSTIIFHNPRSIQNQDYNSSTHYKTSTETFYDKGNSRNPRNTSDTSYIKNMINTYEDEINEDPDDEQSEGMKYSSYDAKNYLSTFTNCMGIHSPCGITAYQIEEKNRSRILQLNNEELLENNVDNAQLHIGKYLTNKISDSKDSEPSEVEESSEELGSVKDFPAAEDEVIILKKPNNLKRESLEFVVNERSLDPDNLGERTNSTDIPTVPAQYRIVTSSLKLKPGDPTEPSEETTGISHVKFTINNKESTTVKYNNDNLKTDSYVAKFAPVPQEATNDTHKRLESCGTSCSERFKHCNERSDYSNAVHELWTNKKSTVDSTDNDSQSSERSCCGESDPKKYNTSKLKFNIFEESKPSTSEGTTYIPLDQLPQPPPSFLETTTLSRSTIFSSLANADQASESDIVINPHALTSPIIRTQSLTKSHADTAPIHYSRRTATDSVHNENINHSRFQTKRSDLIIHRDSESGLKSAVAPPFIERSFVKPQELRPAVPPPASALPPPPPFCCPFVPYMMQYWRNNQESPPASAVPLPETDWKPTVSTFDRAPPPPGIVPIPWFPPIKHLNNSAQSGQMDTRMFDNLHTQPPPEWFLMPRYAPCLPCSRTLESHLGQTDSLTFEDDEPALEARGKQNGKKKGMSNKLFKIFRRKNRPDVEMLEEDEKKLKGRYQRSRYDAKPSNMRMVENDEENFDDQSIWESPDIAGIVTPEEIGRCFRRGFRADGLTLSGDDYLCTKTPSDTTPEQKDVFNFSDHDTPLDFLLGLGFSVDEATAAIRDDEVKNRFKAALTEARIWVPHIATTQGTLLYLLAMKAKPKVMRYFLQLVESIVNKRITNALKLDAYLKILEKVEDGFVSFATLFGKDTGTEDEEDTVIVEKQRRRIFYTIYKYAESEANEVDRPLTRVGIDLLHSLAARFRPAIGPHLRLLACYIGEGLLTKDVQLEAAVIYLSRLDSAYVQLEDLEKYCGLPLSERRRVEQIEKTDP